MGLPALTPWVEQQLRADSQGIKAWLDVALSRNNPNHSTPAAPGAGSELPSEAGLHTRGGLTPCLQHSLGKLPQSSRRQGPGDVGRAEQPGPALSMQGGDGTAQEQPPARTCEHLTPSNASAPQPLLCAVPAGAQCSFLLFKGEQLNGAGESSEPSLWAL